MEALLQSKLRGFYYLTHASYFGVYYFLAMQPHTMYLLACGGLSIFLTGGLLNHSMILQLSVADAQLKSDGETVRFVLYNGQSYNVPVRKICWKNPVKDKVMVATVGEDGKNRNFIFDFSKVRP